MFPVEAADEVKSEADVRAQYELDWTEWPADLGAPYFILIETIMVVR